MGVGHSRDATKSGGEEFDRQESESFVMVEADDSVVSVGTRAANESDRELLPGHSSLSEQAAEEDTEQPEYPIASGDEDSGHRVARLLSDASLALSETEELQRSGSTREVLTAIPTTERQVECQSVAESETNENARVHETLHSRTSFQTESEEDSYVSGGLTPNISSEDLPLYITKHPTDERVTVGSDVHFSLEVGASQSPKMWSWEYSGSIEERKIEGQVAKDSIQKFYYRLIKEVRIDTIVPFLFSEKILSDKTMETVRNANIDSRTKVDQVLEDVLKRVQAHPHCFGCVCKALEEGEVPCVDEIRAEYENKKAASWKVLQDKERFQGSTTSELTISVVQTHDTGRYRCKVSNRVGSRTSQSAILTVEPRTAVQVGGKLKVPPSATKDTAAEPPPAYGSEEKSCDYESMSNFDARSGSPLHQACRDLDWGAFCAYPMTTAAINSKNEHGDTPLHLAISSRAGRANDLLKIIQMLLGNGAKPNISNKDGNCPLHHACSNSSVEAVNSLLQHKADAAVQNNEGKTPLHVACLAGHSGIAESLVSNDPSTVDGRDQEGNTPLHLASKMGNPSIVRTLLRSRVLAGCHHSRVFKQNTDMDTPLHLACERNNFDVVAILLECSNRAVNAQNKEANTALHISCRGGFTELVKLLMKHGADKDHVNREEKVPLDLAPSATQEAIKAALSSEAPVARVVSKKSKFPFPWKRK